MPGTSSADYYPPLGFYYSVSFSISQAKNDARFQTVSGLAVEYEYETFKEGGENRFEHKLPVRTKYSDLVLKRGMLTDSSVFNWLMAAFNQRSFTPSDINIILLNEQSQPLRTWSIAHAIPKKWAVSDLNSGESALVIETLELSYRYFTVQ